MAEKEKNLFPYIHGFSHEEQERLRLHAQFEEQKVYRDIDFSYTRHVLEIGCGVGAQSEILLRRFPKIKLTGIDANERQLEAAVNSLSKLSFAEGRFELFQMDASKLSFAKDKFDGAFICWVLEHVPNPMVVLKEAKRVLKPGGKIYVTEVMNSSFFLDPYCPNVWKYWMSFNDYQYDGAGDPFVGAKLGNFLVNAGFKDVSTKIKSFHVDKRNPEMRTEILYFWTGQLFHSADLLIQKKYVTPEIVQEAKKEMEKIRKDPEAVVVFSFMQAYALS